MQIISSFYAAYIKYKCPNVNIWVYLDDFLITGLVKDDVAFAINLLAEKLKATKWLINEKKTIMEPV